MSIGEPFDIRLRVTVFGFDDDDSEDVLKLLIELLSPNEILLSDQGSARIQVEYLNESGDDMEPVPPELQLRVDEAIEKIRDVLNQK